MISAELRGDTEIVARFDALTPAVHLRLVKTMQELLIRLQEYIRGAKLSGQVLHVRSGNLRRSIGTSLVEEGDRITGKVGIFSGPTLPYGRAHEYGVDTTVNVSEHLRHVKQVFGRPVEATQTVRAHTRHMKLPERSFIRSTMREMGPAAVELINQILRDAVAGGARAA